MIELDTKHDYIYCMSVWVDNKAEFFCFWFMRFHFFFNLDQILPKGIVITFGKVVRPAGGQLVLVGNINVN